MEVKEAKNAKSLKISQSFLAFFAKTTGQNDTKICTVHHINVIYKCSLIKMSLSRKKSKLKIVPTTTTTLTVPWSGLRRRQKCRNSFSTPAAKLLLLSGMLNFYGTTFTTCFFARSEENKRLCRMKIAQRHRHRFGKTPTDSYKIGLGNVLAERRIEKIYRVALPNF